MNQVHILAAIDDSPASRRAWDCAGRLAEAMHGVRTGIAVRTAEHPLPFGVGQGVTTTRGVASVEICRYAESINAALIVLGRGTWSDRDASDHTGGEVVRRSTIPTLHVPADASDCTRTVMPLDGSERGLVALHHGTAIAAALGIPMQVVTVERTDEATVGSASAVTNGPSHRLVARLADLQVKAPLKVLHGDPIEQILHGLTSTDLLVVGYRRGISLEVDRAVGRRLIWRAPGPVLTVPL